MDFEDGNVNDMDFEAWHVKHLETDVKGEVPDKASISSRTTTDLHDFRSMIQLNMVAAFFWLRSTTLTKLRPSYFKIFDSKDLPGKVLPPDQP